MRTKSLPNILDDSPARPNHTQSHSHGHHRFRRDTHRRHANSFKKGSLSFSKSHPQSLLLHSPISPSTGFVYDPSLPIDLLPPVNTTSLREIDLQEVFKNPQLRHDIVFDPLLQFRPNLDGERGKRKRASTEHYWDLITAELQDLAISAENSSYYVLNAQSKLPYLFISMRDILDSLLPVKDRAYVDSVLDPDLLLRQLRHCALDFVALANWLSSVFKAHCAPMRDSWVDQMVARIESGVDSRSPQRIVEGLRMTFAILEAMKLDVANHQIRTLRPVLVDTAIEFEQGYYHQIMDKGKFNMHDSLLWYTKNLAKYKDHMAVQKPSVVQKPSDVYSSAFCYALCRLLSCASDDLVSEFPSSFGFDFTRLADFRAELRQIVCMHLCVSLFQILLRRRFATFSNRQTLFASSFSPLAIHKLKSDLMAIIADPYGNTKWTKNTSTLALELASRVQIATSPASTRRINVVPDADLVDMATGWLTTNLQPKSEVYKVVEKKVIQSLCDQGCKSLRDISQLDQPLPLRTSAPASDTTTPTPSGPVPFTVETAAHREIETLSSKLLLLTRFHWGVFGKYYISFATLGSEDYSSATGLGPLGRDDVLNGGLLTALSRNGSSRSSAAPNDSEIAL